MLAVLFFQTTTSNCLYYICKEERHTNRGIVEQWKNTKENWCMHGCATSTDTAYMSKNPVGRMNREWARTGVFLAKNTSVLKRSMHFGYWSKNGCKTRTFKKEMWNTSWGFVICTAPEKQKHQLTHGAVLGCISGKKHNIIKKSTYSYVSCCSWHNRAQQLKAYGIFVR